MTGFLGAIDTAVQRAGAFGRMRYIRPLSYKEATGDLRAIYDQVLREYGLGGPLFVTSVSLPLLAGTWGLIRQSQIGSPLGRGEAELIAAAVAKAEECPFCVDVHSELAAADGERDTAALVAAGEWDALRERGEPSDSLALWARDFVHGRAAAPPVAAELAPHAISVAMLFVHVTTLVTIFQDEGLVAGAGGSGTVDRVMKLYMRHSLGKRMLDRGPSEEPIPGAPAVLRDSGYAFTSDEPALDQAWARLDVAAEETATEVLSEHARAIVDDTVREHVPGEPALSLPFLEAAISRADVGERGAVRLALLSAYAPYRVTEADVEAAGDGGERGERWVAIASYGVRARLHRLGGWRGA